MLQHLKGYQRSIYDYVPRRFCPFPVGTIRRNYMYVYSGIVIVLILQWKVQYFSILYWYLMVICSDRLFPRWSNVSSEVVFESSVVFLFFCILRLKQDPVYYYNRCPKTYEKCYTRNVPHFRTIRCFWYTPCLKKLCWQSTVFLDTVYTDGNYEVYHLNARKRITFTSRIGLAWK